MAFVGKSYSLFTQIKGETNEYTYKVYTNLLYGY
jgi:hypothetical protein